MRNIVQVNFLREWILMLACWLADFAGGEIVRPGWRQIPAGYCDFDPALADHFKSLKMQNGKHITLAVSYSVIVKWNRSNKRRGRDERTYGSDSYYAKNYAGWVDRKTWGRHMDDLKALGLVLVTTIKDRPAYEAVSYQIVKDKLSLGAGHDGQGAGHDDHVHGHDGQGAGHDDHPIIESSKKKSSVMGFMDKTSSTPARDAADEIAKPTQPEDFDRFKAQIPEVRDVIADVDGDDELLHQPAPTDSPRPIIPVPRSPSSPDEDCEAIELQKFFTGKTIGEIKALIAQHGTAKIYTTIKGAAASKNVFNPPGFVLDQLAAGTGGMWQLPKRADPDIRDYVGGKYADFIEH